MYLTGIGTDKDERKAEHDLKKAADLKNTYAMYQLAKLYLKQEQEKEQREEIDYEKIEQAKNLLKTAVKDGNKQAAYFLGKLYAEGRLIQKEFNQTIFNRSELPNHRTTLEGKRWQKQPVI